MKHYLRLMRIKHYIKNLLIFFPLFFSERLKENGGSGKSLIITTLLAFAAFCFICSFVYIFNDLCDVKNDRAHPTKKNRPIASGRVPVLNAVVLGGALLVVSAAILIFIKADIYTWLCAIVYILINIAYSKGLKNVPVFDIAILGAGYPIRIMYGGFVSGIPVSAWLFLTTLCISFYLGAGKRRGEYVKYRAAREDSAEAKVTRPVLYKYDLQYLESHMYLCLGLGIAFYSFWAMEKSTALIYTVPIVLLIIMKYNLLLYGEKEVDGDPIETLFKSKGLILLMIIYAVYVLLFMYVL